MGLYLQKFKESFRFKKDFWYTLFVDAGFLGVMWFLIYYLGGLVQQKAYALSGGKTAEQIQQMMLSMEAEQSAALLANIQGFVFVFVLSLTILLVGGLLLFSLSRKLVWDRLTGKRFNRRKFWRWNLLNLALIVPVFMYLLISGILRSVLNSIISLLKMTSASAFFDWLFSLFFIFVLFILMFLVYHSFTEKYKVWESIGDAFALVKADWKKIWPMILSIVFTAVVLSSFLWLFGRIFVQPGVQVGANIVVSLLFIAWMRIYVFRTVKNEPERIPEG